MGTTIFYFEKRFKINSPVTNDNTSKDKFFNTVNLPVLITYIQHQREASRPSEYYPESFRGRAPTTFIPKWGQKNIRDAIIPFNHKPKDPAEKPRNLKIGALLNPRKGKIDFKILPDTDLEIDLDNEKVEITLKYPYTNFTADSDIAKYAIMLKIGNIKDLTLLLPYLALQLNAYGKEEIRRKMKMAFDKYDNASKNENNVNKIDWLYEQAPDFILGDRTDADLWRDFKTLINSEIDTDSTNEYTAIFNLLASIKNPLWFYDEVNKNPDPVRKLISKSNSDHRFYMMGALTRIGIRVWSEEELNNSLPYTLGVNAVDPGMVWDADYAQQSSFSVYQSDSKKFKIGTITHYFEKGSGVSFTYDENLLGLVDAFAPLRIISGEDEFWLPAFAGEYFTNKNIDNELRNAVNIALTVLLPEITYLKLSRLYNVPKTIKVNTLKALDRMIITGRKIANRLTRVKSPTQLESEIEALYLAAAQANKELKSVTTTFARQTKGKPKFRPQNINNGLKDKGRVLEKLNDYGGSAKELLDIAGSTVLYKDLDALNAALQKFDKDFIILRIKDRFLNPTPGGYRDILINIQMKNGHVVEFRMGLEALDKVSKRTHKLYESRRSLEAIEKRKLTLKQKLEINRLAELEKKINQDAWNNFLTH